MRLKLDENLGRQAVELFRAAGHEVATVLDQGMASSPDDALTDLKAAAETLCGALEDLDVEGRLWVVQAGRVRIYQPPDDLDL